MMMNSSEWVLKVILSRYPPTSRISLERFLPQEERARLHAMPATEVDTELEEPPLLERIHWSWILPILEPLSLRDQKLYLNILPPFSRKNLCHELKIRSLKEFDSRIIVQEYLLQTLLETLTGEPLQLLPVYFLPPSPLSSLLRMSKQELIELIDALSLIDLAAELRQIVETKILKKIYSFLSEEEKKALKKVANISQLVPVARLHVEKWDGTEKSLRLMLHKRGLARLGAALSLQHPDFIWYICHQLDIGRGKALEKLASAEVSHSSRHHIIHQIEELLKERIE